MTGYDAIYDPDEDFDRWYTTLAARRIRPHLAPADHVLELGSATGLMTTALTGEGRRFTCIERSSAYLARTTPRPGVRLVHSTIEAFAPDDDFDRILAVNILHELPDPDAALRRLLPRLRPHGHLHVTLPNPCSLHRLSAHGAGLIGDLADPSPRGLAFQTLRLPTAASVIAAMGALGLDLIDRGAILPKPLPNAAMACLSDPLIEAWDALSPLLPDHGAMTWFMFRHAHA